MKRSNDKTHFRTLNKIYYQDLERIHKLLISPGARVLEIGCGTGDLLAAVLPKYGVGVEIDSNKIELARIRFKELFFYQFDVELMSTNDINSFEPFDVIIINNTLNTIKDVSLLLENLANFSHNETRLIITFHNWLWQPFLKFAEKIGQREPQPPESWLTPGDIRNLLDLSGWEVLKNGQRCLIPRDIPFLTPLANRWLSQIPLLEKLCLTHWMVARLEPKPLNKSSVSVIIPARNEAGNIKSAINRLPELGSFTEAIFVEGHSSDHTWKEIEKISETYNGPIQISKYRQLGKGKADAVWLGFEKAKGDILIILDADLTVRPEDLPRFVQALNEGSGEFINGCRLVYPRSKEAMPLLNTLANRFFAAIFSWLLRQRLKDTLCGTKVLWKRDYERIRRGRKYFGDFDPFGDFDLLFGANKLNLKIVEVPVRYQARFYGSSNISHVKEGLILGKMCLVAANKLRFIP